MIDLKVYNTLKPQKGRLLLTEPFENGEYFNQAVVLICEHNDEGTFGFVLNNYSDIELTDLAQLPDFETNISTGGPVGNKNLYYIHTLGDKLKGSIPVTKEIYVGGDFEELQQLMNLGIVKPNEIRFFIGYSGWVYKQLEGELKQNSWLVADIQNIDEIMNTKIENLWRIYMGNQGGKYKAFAHFPKYPGQN